MAALAAALAQVTLGGVVRVTGSGLGCPDWPLCHGRIIPPLEVETLIEYSHRLSASVVSVLVLATAVVGWALHRSWNWATVPSALGVALVALAAALGGVSVMTELASGWVLVHLGVAELLVACMAVATVAGWRWSGPAPPDGAGRAFTPKLSFLLAATLVGTFALMLSGSYMVGEGAGSSCATWPLCRGALLPDGHAYVAHMSHRFVVAIVGVMIAATAASVWRQRGPRPELRWASGILGGLFAAQVLLGAGTVWSGFEAGLKAAHLSLASLVWTALVLLAALAYVPRRTAVMAPVASPRTAGGLERMTP